MTRLNHQVGLLLALFTLACLPPQGMAQDKPNIVLVFMDNFGWGEPGFNGGGIIRGAATPRLDKLASDATGWAKRRPADRDRESNRRAIEINPIQATLSGRNALLNRESVVLGYHILGTKQVSRHLVHTTLRDSTPRRKSAHHRWQYLLPAWKTWILISWAYFVF